MLSPSSTSASAVHPLQKLDHILASAPQTLLSSILSICLRGHRSSSARADSSEERAGSVIAVEPHVSTQQEQIQGYESESNKRLTSGYTPIYLYPSSDSTHE